MGRIEERQVRDPKRPGKTRTAYYIVYDAPPGPDGKRRQIRRRVVGTRNDAGKALDAAEAAAQQGLAPSRDRATIAAYLERWIAWNNGRVGPRTLDFYRMVVEQHIDPRLGRIRLESLSPLQIEEWLSEKRKADLSDRTLHHLYRVLSTALRRAVRWRLIHRNPCDGVDPPTVRAAKPAVLDAPALRDVIAALRGDWLYLPVLLAVCVGLRRGEIAGLRWGDIDLDRGVLSVQRSIGDEHVKGARELPPKWGSEGLVALPQLLTDELRGARLLASDKTGWVILGPGGEMARPDLITKRWERWRRAHGVGITFHQLRHSQGGLLVSAGVHPRVAQEQLRHSTLAMMEHYGHVVPPEQVEAARRIDALLRGNRDEPSAR